jgi:hypothetical protein
LESLKHQEKCKFKELKRQREEQREEMRNKDFECEQLELRYLKIERILSKQTDDQSHKIEVVKLAQLKS